MPNIVVVTGASAGVGRALVRRFAQDGAKIGLIARGRERLEAAADEVRAAGGEALVLPLDVADANAVDKAASAVENTFGPIDIWVNAAMVTVFGPFEEVSADEFRRGTEVTYLGCVHGTMSALKRMAPRDRGTIVQVGSALAYRSVPLQSVYCGAKHAIVGFTDSLRSELIHNDSHVQLTAVHLPAVNTPQFDWARNKMDRRPQPIPPIYEPELIAEGIHHAALHPKREYWLGTPAWKAILGQRVAPGLADHMLASSAWDGQMTQERAVEERADNLFAPAPGNHAARGRFSGRAAETAPSVWASEHVDLIVGIGAAFCLGVVGAAALSALDKPRDLQSS